MHKLVRQGRVALSATFGASLLLALLTALAGTTSARAEPQASSAGAKHASPALWMGRKGVPLVDKVLAATRQFLNVNVALHEGWTRGTPCVSGPSSGAMGVHFILPKRVGDGLLDANEPEALIYEPLPSGALRLVGVEFIVLAADWARLHPEGGAPAVDGHLTNYVGEPNRYGLPAFYELHVWAWEHNPNGSFADWNSQVSCDNQRAG